MARPEASEDEERKMPTTPSPRVPAAKAAVDIGRRHAFYENPRGRRFNIVALHRMNMHQLRKRLLDVAADVFTAGELTDESSDALASLISSYCAAVRDREYMRDWALRDWGSNPFVIKPERGELESGLLLDLAARGVAPCTVVDPEEELSGLLPRLPGWPWDMASALRTRRERYVLALLGGLTLTVPMVFMVLVGSRAASLATVCVCTVLFALALSYFFPQRLPTELLTAVAAYTAVLVVFVGGSTAGAG